MALEAFFTMDDDPNVHYIVDDVEYELSTPITNNYKPSGTPEGGLVHFTMRNSSEHFSEFLNWFINMSQKSCTLFLPTIKSPDLTYRPYRLVLTNAYCVGFREVYSMSSGKQLQTYVTISAQEISWKMTGGYAVTFKNRALKKSK